MLFKSMKNSYPQTAFYICIECPLITQVISYFTGDWTSFFFLLTPLPYFPSISLRPSTFLEQESVQGPCMHQGKFANQLNRVDMQILLVETRFIKAKEMCI